MHHDPIADLHVGHLVAHGVDDAGGIGPDDVEIDRLIPASLCLRHVDRHTSGRPDVVEVHAGSHDHHQGIVRPELGHVDHLAPDGMLGLAEAVGAHELRVHLRRHVADRRDLTERVQVLAHGSHLLGSSVSGSSGGRVRASYRRPAGDAPRPLHRRGQLGDRADGGPGHQPQ